MRLLRFVYSSGEVSILSGAATEALSKLAVVAALWVGSGLVIGGELTPGELMSFYALIAYFTGPASKLVTSNRAVQDALIAADRLFEILDIDQEQARGSSVTPRSGSHPVLAYEDVTFRYGTNPALLKGVTLRLEPGTVTAVVGESGCGKSTLIALAQNLYAPSSGRVTVDGYDVRMIESEWLLRQVAVVPQAIHLFNGTAIENIAVGESSPNMLRLLEVCDTLGITDFIEALPHGFRTVLGENGTRLSGGQRQRLAIARALYRDPAILLLDEATSSLDAVSERFVKRALGDLKQMGKSILIIGHRLASIADADRIVVMEGGRITSSGTHAELMELEGLYRRLWDSQNRVEASSASTRAGLVTV